MTDREKLIKLMTEAHIDFYRTFDPTRDYYGTIADHLIANGVTFAKDMDVPSKWISVKDKLPENPGLVLGWDMSFGTIFAYYHGDMTTSAWQYITHWMPLPMPPKEEDNGK